MKSKIFLIIVALSIYSCKEKTESEKLTEEIFKQKYIDSLSNEIQQDAYSDSTGMHTSPVVVVASKIVDKEYSNYRDIYIKFKNISDKTIEGIKFEWYGVDAFGDPADMGNYMLEGWGSGLYDKILKPNKTVSGSYNIMSSDAKKIKMVRAYEVVFEDGSYWKLEDQKKLIKNE